MNIIDLPEHSVIVTKAVPTGKQKLFAVVLPFPDWKLATMLCCCTCSRATVSNLNLWQWYSNNKQCILDADNMSPVTDSTGKVYPAAGKVCAGKKVPLHPPGVEVQSGVRCPDCMSTCTSGGTIRCSGCDIWYVVLLHADSATPTRNSRTGHCQRQ